MTVRSTSWTMQIGASFFARFATVEDLFFDFSISDYLDGREPWPAECPIPSRRVVLAEL